MGHLEELTLRWLDEWRHVCPHCEGEFGATFDPETFRHQPQTIHCPHCNIELKTDPHQMVKQMTERTVVP